MKPPPFLILAALLFWGWQSDFLLVGAIMGSVLEGARWVKFRWELDDSDFNRIWSFCVLLVVVLGVYVFSTNSEGGLAGLFQGNAARNVANATSVATTRFLGWLPMTFFAFVAAQTFNVRSSVPLTAISLVLGWRRRRGDQAFAGYYVNIAYPYFIACLFAAGIHANNGTQIYFWGQGVLIAWALWTIRPSRFGKIVWFGALLAVFALGFLEMVGISQAERAIQNFNSQWIARLLGQRPDPLQSMTSMGRIGQLKLSAKIVVWLEPAKLGVVPAYLREASFRSYQARRMTWYAGGTLKDFEGLQVEPDNTSWILVPGKTGAAGVNIACYLNGWSRELGAPEGLLPLPSGVSRLDNVAPNMILKRNHNGALLAAGRGLLIFDAHYGSGATLDAPPDTASTNQYDLQVPPEETNALARVIAEINPAGLNEAQKLRAVGKFFLDKFTYSTWQGPEKLAATNATPLTTFLLTSRSGHCEYFASATVLLLRQLHIPARYAVGYSVHEPRGSGYIVRERDAHAWCLVWNDATKCWEDFDTTPPSWVAAESRRTAAGEWFADLRSWLGFQIAKFRWRQTNFQQYVFWALIPVLLVLLGHIIFRRRKKLLSRPAAQPPIAPVIWPGLDSEFYQLESKLAARGVPRQTGEPLADWLARALTSPAPTGLRAALEELLNLHYRYRFDPQGLSATERESLRQKAKASLDTLLRAKS
jgi:transglutaminase-like putative cysteine protease